MKTRKTFSKKLLLLFSVAAISTYGILLACGGFDFSDDYNSNFTPEAFVSDASYNPLFFSPKLFYKGEDLGSPSRFNENIIKDWSGYLQNRLPKQDLKFLLLDDNAKTNIELLYGCVKNKQPAPKHYGYLNISDARLSSFLEFMHYAKIIEASSAITYGWDYDKIKISYVNTKVIADVDRLYNSTSDTYLKNRYWFQTMKAHFYSANKQNVITFFEKTKSAVPVNILYYRGLAYVAGTYYKAKDYTKSNYLYSIVFDKCPELRAVMTYNFHPQEQKDFEGSLALAKTTEEKVALWALFGYYADEKIGIQEIYRLNPTSSHLDFLLTRLVNKEETQLNEYQFSSASDYQQAMKKSINKNALQLVNNIASENRTGKPFLWNTAAGYLNIFAGNYSIANKYFAQASIGNNNAPLATAQLRLLNLINFICNTNLATSKDEENLLTDLMWLYNNPVVHNDFRYQNAVRWSRRYISSLYKDQGKTILAELFNSSGQFYREEKNSEAMKVFLVKPGKTPMEKFANTIYNISLADIFEYQAIMRAYSGKLDEAIELTMKSELNYELLGNPFNGKIKDCNDCDHAITLRVPYTKLTFLKKMKEMQALVEKGQDVYNNSLLLGNAFYNMSYFGNARVFYSNKILNQDGHYIDPFYQPILLNSSTARKFYQRAFDAAVNNEQKAKCSYLIAKCERNDFYTAEYHSKPGFYSDVPIAFKEWNGFKKLRDDYMTTKYYQEVVNECGYFSKYVGQ